MFAVTSTELDVEGRPLQVTSIHNPSHLEVKVKLSFNILYLEISWIKEIHLDQSLVQILQLLLTIEFKINKNLFHTFL